MLVGILPGDERRGLALAGGPLPHCGQAQSDRLRLQGRVHPPRRAQRQYAQG